MIKLDHLSAAQILQHINKGEISSREVTGHFIEKIKQVNPSLNAVVIELFKDALEKADRADELFKQGKRLGKLHGLPFTIKECFDFKGTPSTLGVMRRKSDIRHNTDTYIEALEAEGAIVLGKTNVAQLLGYFESCNPVYGVTNNPYSEKHTCGGSTGGEGAIISAGGSPVGIGTDIGGSLRIPAAFCGICSIKPTMSRIVDHTRIIDDQPNLSVNSVAGVLANAAEDLQLVLEILNDTAAKERQVQPLQNFKDVDVTKLKVGYFLTDGLVEPMPAIKRGVMETVEQLKKMGVEVTEFSPPDLKVAEELFIKIMTADKAPLFVKNLGNEKAMPQVAALLTINKMPLFMRKFLTFLLGVSGQKSAKRIIGYFGGEGEKSMNEIVARQKAFTESYIRAMDNSPIGKLDAVISPVCALPAYLHNTSDKVATGGAYTVQHNLTGFPSGVATVSKVKPEEAIGRKTTADIQIKTAAKIEAASAGLPIGIQIAAKHWDEHIVLALINRLHVKMNNM